MGGILPNWAVSLHSFCELVLDHVEVLGSLWHRMMLLVVLADHPDGLELVGRWFIRVLLLEGAVLGE